MAQNFNASGFLTRFVFALTLVFASFNPSGYSYFHWAKNVLPAVEPVLAIAGIALVIGWVIFIRATLRSLGALGIALAIAFFGCIMWLIIDTGLVSADNTSAMLYIILILLSAVLATGMSWSHIRRRLSGQADIDDVDEG